MTATDLDLFGEPVRLIKRPDAYASPPGSGPDGATCRTCGNLLRAKIGNTTASKCVLVNPGGGAATDINMHTAACRQYEAREGDAQVARIR